MGERRGTKALELWCRRITDGYPGVKVENMTTSWRDGLAFCAMIHHFRPELIEFDKLNKNDVYYNNDLAFRTAEAHLGIPALLDADDMATYEVPDRLSILTYLSQFYQVFAAQGKRNIGLICSNYDATNRLKRTSTTADKSTITKTPGPPPKMAHIVGVPKREPCRKCALPVFLAERISVGKSIYHRTCLKCARCKSQLSLGSFYETENDGEFCCETCPDEESTPSPTATTSFHRIGMDNGTENESPNRNVAGARGSIADRLAFFEKSASPDANPLLQKSVSDEEKSQSLKKIAAQYKPNAALSNFMSNTLNVPEADANDFNIEPDEISSLDGRSKCDTTTNDTSDDDNEEIGIKDEDRPPALPKDGPPIEHTGYPEESDEVLSVTVESPEIINNNKNEQVAATTNAASYISNSKVFLTASPSKKFIKADATTATQNNHKNHLNTNANDTNINITNNNMMNDLNLSSNVTKDISNIQNDNEQTRTTINTKQSDDENDDDVDVATKATDAATSSSTIGDSLSNVELRRKVEESEPEPPKTSTSSRTITPIKRDVPKFDATEQRLSVVRARLQQFEEVSKSEDDEMNNSRKLSTISISSSNKLNNIENSKLDDKSIKEATTARVVAEESKMKANLNVNTTGNEVPNENTNNTIETEILSKNETDKTEDKNSNNCEAMEVDLTCEKERTWSDVKQTEGKIETIEDKEINIDERMKLSEDEKQTAAISVSNSQLNDSNAKCEESDETSTSARCERVEIASAEQIQQIPQKSANNIVEDIKSSPKMAQKSSPLTTDEKQPLNEAAASTSELSTVTKTESKTKSDNKETNDDYPDELNPFASDDDDEELQDNKVLHRSKTNQKKNDTDRRKSMNPFSSDDDDEDPEQNKENQQKKAKPPRPPPPKISKNPFGSESEEEFDETGSGNTSLVSMGSSRRPVPTPRGQLTPSAKHNLTPEPTPRSARQTYSATHRLNNSNDYYGSNISLSSSITSPSKDASFYRQHDTRSSNNSLASSAGGSSGVNTMRSRKKKAPAPPPPTVGTAKITKELFPPNDVESKMSTPTSSSPTTPQMSRKKRPAPKPPSGLTPTRKLSEANSSENVPDLSANAMSTTELNASSATAKESSVNQAESLPQVELSKLSDEEKVAHLDGRQFFLEETSASSKVSEIHQKEESSLSETNISTKMTTNIEPNMLDDQKTGDVECQIPSNSDEINLHKNMNNLDDKCNESTKTNHINDSSGPESIEVQHDRHIEKIKDNKESKNRNRQSQHYNDDIHNDPLLNKSIHGKWKRRKGPAPSLPVPPRKVLQMLPLQEIRHELDIIEVQQQGLEKQGVVLETMIRERCEGKNGELIDSAGNLNEKQPNTKEVEDLILQLFELVNEKNELFRRQAELMYLRRQHRLEQEQADLEYEIRVLMAQPERNKTDTDKAREEALIARLVEVVQLRNDVIESLEMDRLREAEEDLSIKQRLEMHTAKRDEELSKQTPTKLSKKEKKKQKELKKHGKSKKIDADKDADESEISIETQKKKKKRKFLFSVLTSKSD